MDVRAYMLLLVGIMIGVIGQLLLKYGMSRRPGFQLSEITVLAREFPVFCGFCCYGIATLLYLKVLASLDLSLAYPTVSLGYVLVVLMSRAIFKERVTPARWVAVVMIVVGVALVGLGSS